MILIMAVAAVSRTPELMPPNFSAMIALAFCAGVYFPGHLGWLLPMGTMLVTDLVLNQFVYGVSPLTREVLAFMAANYAVYLVVIFLGRRFSRRASFAGSCLILVNTGDFLLRVLDITGLRRALTVQDRAA